jgi:rhodanese-related sulfurtransferase
MPNTRRMHAPVPTLEVPELLALRAAAAQELALFDVREAGEAHRGHLYGASFLPRRQIELRIAELVPRRDTDIVVYDGGEGDTRAARAALTLAGLGYRQVRALAGGVRAWQDSGQALTEGSNVPSKLFGEAVHEAEQVPRLPAQELKRWQEAARPHLVLDIRSPEEYARSRIPGALGAYGTELALLAADLRAAGKPVIVHCSGRTRSIIACATLRALGVEEAYALENGTMGWQLAGYTLEREAGAGVLAPTAGSAATGETGARALALSAGAQALPRAQFEAWMQERAAGRANVYPIDVRQLERYTAGHIAGSTAVPGGLAIQRADEFVPVRAARVVFIDDGEARAWLAAWWYRRMGFAQVYVLEGGLAAWTQAGGTLDTGRGRTAPAGWAGAQRLARTLAPEALHALSTAALNVNVDTSRQYAQARLPGSIWIRYGDLEDRVTAMDAAERQRLVLSCRDGTLSTLAAANLAREGHGEARVLAGGVEAWKRAGYPVDSGADGAAAQAGDLVVQPYDAGREGMQRYLAWEQQLTARHAQARAH